jgi:cytosine/uracil/thiamine/allantoin permease
MVGTLLTFFIILCIVGLILWGVGQIPGLPPIFKTAIYVVVGVILLIWLLNQVGGGNMSFGNFGYRH